MAPLNRRSAGARTSERGAELIEFALALPVLLLVLAGILDFGLLLNNYAVVTNAAREGARYAAVPGAADADVRARVEKYIAGAGLQTSDVTTTVDPVAIDVNGRNLNAVKVTVSYPYSFLILGPIARLIANDPVAAVTLKTAATMRAEVAAGL